jgi:D-alanine-D-alanine ligase
MPKKKKKRVTKGLRRSVVKKKKSKSKMRIAIVSGGPSAERTISQATAAQVAKFLDQERYAVKIIDIDATGLWQSKLSPKSTDVVFNALHGAFGEDGMIQGFLEARGLCYTGSGVAASAIGMDKVLTKQICMAVDIAVPPAIVVSSRADAYLHAPLPAVIKPTQGGSSVGVTVVHSQDELRRGVGSLLKHSSVMIEPVIVGREISVPVLGTQNPKALAIAEIIPQKGEPFFTYDAKYKKGRVIEDVPANLPEVARQRAERAAVMVHNRIGARGYSRVDMIITPNNECRVLEINTLPGLSSASIYPKCAAASGIPMGKLLDTLIEDALTR